MDTKYKESLLDIILNNCANLSCNINYLLGHELNNNWQKNLSEKQCRRFKIIIGQLEANLYNMKDVFCGKLEENGISNYLEDVKPHLGEKCLSALNELDKDKKGE
jgi:hypothetical protein